MGNDKDKDKPKEQDRAALFARIAELEAQLDHKNAVEKKMREQLADLSVKVDEVKLANMTAQGAGKMMEETQLAMQLMLQNKKKQAAELISKNTGRDFKIWEEQLATSGNGDDPMKNFPEDVRPPTADQFGSTNNITSDHKRFMRDTLSATEKTRSSFCLTEEGKLCLEDKLRFIKEMMEEYDYVFSEKAVVKLLLSCLDENSGAREVRQYQKDGLRLQEIWSRILVEFKTQPSPFEAQAMAREATQDMTESVITNIMKIKFLTSLYVTAGSQEMHQTAIQNAKDYLDNLVNDPADPMVANIMSFVSNTTGDKWTTMIQEVRSRVKILEDHRATRAKKQQKKTGISSIKGEEDTEKMVNRLSSELGQQKKDVARLQTLWGQRGGNKQGNRQGNNGGNRNGNRNGGPRSVRDRLTPEALAVVDGHCFLCGEDHTGYCTKYAGASVMSSLCRRCNKGCHHSRLCREQRDSQEAPPAQDAQEPKN